jgi:hypothetical protein
VAAVGPSSQFRKRERFGCSDCCLGGHTCLPRSGTPSYLDRVTEETAVDVGLLRCLNEFMFETRIFIPVQEVSNEPTAHGFSLRDRCAGSIE